MTGVQTCALPILMNERIQKLIVESDNGQFHKGKLYPHIGSRTNEDWQRFAELIIKECAAFLNEYDFNDIDEFEVGGNNGVVRIAAENLKEHFGVE